MHRAEESDYINPDGTLIVGGALGVTNINGDVIAGTRELPDGVIVKLTPHNK